MNPINPQTASDYATAFSTFVHQQPMVVSIVLALVVSWGGTATLASLLRALLPDTIERAVIRLVDVLLATLVALYTWPTEPAIWWALAIGVSSPFGYALLSELLCWKWPSLKPYLSLRELSEPEAPVPPKTKPEDL